MTFTYTIKNAANPEDPNEQLPGTEICDDRLFERPVTAVLFAGQAYTKEFFFKNHASNKLTLSVTGLSFVHNSIVVVLTT